MEINAETKRRMRIMVIIVGSFFAAIFVYKLIAGLFYKLALARYSPVVTVSAMKADYSPWQPAINSVGSTRAIRGVNVTTEERGMVRNIYFAPGAMVQENTVLVQLDISTEINQLHALEAKAEMAAITYKRDKEQFAAKAISKETLDTDLANLKSLLAQVAEEAASIHKKTIRAPFTGRLGISAVNPGQFLNAADKVVTLQQLDPMYVDFYVPQQLIGQLAVGQVVKATVDAVPGKTFIGKITTIDPIADVNTRNVEIEATFSNPLGEILPGMFAAVEVTSGKPQSYITLPQSAVTFNPYGDIVYVVEEKNSKKIVTQSFVKVGETRGDQIAILDGIKAGDTVVTSGQLKLKNGSEVAINNSVQPENSPNPVIKEKA